MKSNYNVASFNLRFDNPADKENSWEHRKEHVLQMMKYYSWDVIGLQEVRGNQLDELRTLSEYSYVGIGRDNDHISEHGPIFYKKELFEEEDSGTFWLSLTPESPSKSWESDCMRICTWIRLKDIRNGNAILFLNTHLDHVSEEARFQGAKLITSWIEQQAANVPVILTGDFNASTQERGYQQIRLVLQDSRRAEQALHYGPHGTFTDFDYNMPWEQLKEIDYIFTSQQVKVLKTRAIVDSFNGRYPSDHFPITAAIEI